MLVGVPASYAIWLFKSRIVAVPEKGPPAASPHPPPVRFLPRTGGSFSPLPACWQFHTFTGYRFHRIPILLLDNSIIT